MDPGYNGPFLRSDSITTAIWFRAAWTRSFNPSRTEDQPFHLEPDGEVRVPLMHREDRFGYAEGEGYRAVDLPYRGTHLSMLILLPEPQGTLTGLESRFSTDLLQDCDRRLSAREVDLLVPRFRMDSGPCLKTTLEALGMGEAFDPGRADFSGITGHRAPHPDAVFPAEAIQKAMVEVDEEGTEAAAAAGLLMMLGMPGEQPPAPVFRADRPFLFAIRDQTTGVILSLGTLSDPAARV